ncbi:MAG TPA: MBL fold metallo-hydrolase [Phycisphaerae bacterium]|nr:MBL fold metallo-hydrolase [Phycisphaerae bacterium]
MSVSYCVVSIGTLSRNRLWGEQEPRRVPHATTTLIRSGSTVILVDPSLPGEVLKHRLDERAGLRPEQIDVVFLTTFRPVHRRGLGLFPQATWLAHKPEMEATREHLAGLAAKLEAGVEAADGEVEQMVREERELLGRFQAADDRLTPQVHLYPTAGVTPGAAGLLLTEVSRTVLVAGDAVVTQDYFEAGRVFEKVVDVDQARASLEEIHELADEVVPGHDNAFRVAGR